MFGRSSCLALHDSGSIEETRKSPILEELRSKREINSSPKTRCTVADYVCDDHKCRHGYNVEKGFSTF